MKMLRVGLQTTSLSYLLLDVTFWNRAHTHGRNHMWRHVVLHGGLNYG